MKLYELPRNAKFNLIGDNEKRLFALERIDGAYSVCYLGDKLIHLSASAEVEVVDGSD